MQTKWVKQGHASVTSTTMSVPWGTAGQDTRNQNRWTKHALACLAARWRINKEAAHRFLRRDFQVADSEKFDTYLNCFFEQRAIVLHNLSMQQHRMVKFIELRDLNRFSVMLFLSSGTGLFIQHLLQIEKKLRHLRCTGFQHNQQQQHQYQWQPTVTNNNHKYHSIIKINIASVSININIHINIGLG